MPERPERKVGLIVFDGLGFNRERTNEVAKRALAALPQALRQRVEDLFRNASGIGSAGPDRDREPGPETLLYPVFAEALASSMPTGDALKSLKRLGDFRDALSPEEWDVAMAVIGKTATDMRYVPWAADAPHLTAMRNDHLSIPTRASGKWAGFEELDPPVQGNSDTGHQQIGNLRIAPQTPLEITEAITSGAFFENEVMREAMQAAKAYGGLSFCFMLSGMGGADGRVHSAWNHLEAFLELVFSRAGLTPDQVKMQAILDGRDCPGDSSIKPYGSTGDYIGGLEKLLRRFDAVESLAWVIGRNIAMDRDFREENCRKDYLLLTRGEGRHAQGFEGARRLIEEDHASGKSDTQIEPIVVEHDNRPKQVVTAREIFVNLQFRADRQRAKTAAMVGAKQYLLQETESRGRPWELDWLDDLLRLQVFTFSDYHPALVDLGAKPAFPTKPQPDNFLAAFPHVLPGARYALIGESNKSAHMGYFIRGRREEPDASGVELRKIIASTGADEGVTSDSDFYKTPAMRAFEIADTFVERMSTGEERLICCNLSNCDMIGHLLPERFEEAIAAYEAVDQATDRIVTAAREYGYDVILTSDHGNIEDDTSAHSVNDILTTVIPASGEFHPGSLKVFQANLFDISWTIGTLFGVEDRLVRQMKEAGRYDPDDELMGRPLIQPR